jgi:hypothetical protein
MGLPENVRELSIVTYFQQTHLSQYLFFMSTDHLK